MKTRKPKILSVRLNRKVDSDPDLSFLGEYSDETPSDHAIDRKELGDQGRNQCRYFEPARHTSRSEWSHVTDEQVEEAYEKAKKQRDFSSLVNADNRDAMIDALNEYYSAKDYERMEAYNRGDWCMVGIHASAQIASGNGIIQHLRSGGVWGIESDSSKEHFAEIEQQELEGLRAELEGFGFGKRQIDYAFKRVERGQE